MTEQAKIEALYRRIANERRKVLKTAAESDVLPPANLLAYLADLDGSIVAVKPCLRSGRVYSRPRT